jgi:uncharacterized protein (DUF433 family)
MVKNMVNIDNSGEKLYRTLTTPIYLLTEASLLVGISRGRVSRWIKGYEYTYSVGNEKRQGKQKSVINHCEEPCVSFLDLIDLLFVKRFLEYGITLQYLRLALEEARSLLGTPHFARNTFYTNGKQITVDLEPKSKYMITLMTDGQIAIPTIIGQLDDKIDFENVTGFGLARRWYPNGKNGLIVIDPQISFGRPTLIGRGVATESVYDLYLGENKKLEPVSKWYKIPPQEVKAAINFQSSLVGI